MKWKRTLLAGAALLALAGAVWAQTTVVVQNLTGNEILRAAVGSSPGGSGFFTTVNALRNATGYVVVPTGTTVNTAVSNTAAKVVGSGAITTWNITLPTAPYDGQMVEVVCPGGTSTVAISASSPAGVAIIGTAFTACTAGGAAANSAEFIYSTANNKWYRIQ